MNSSSGLILKKIIVAVFLTAVISLSLIAIICAAPVTIDGSANNPGNFATSGSGQRKIAVDIQDTNKLYAVYASSRTGDSFYQIYFSSSNDRGSNWSSPVLISTKVTGMADYNQQAPSIAVSTYTIHVVWHGMHSGSPSENSIWYSSASVYGGSWSNPFRVSGVAGAMMMNYDQRYPSIGCGYNESLHVAWSGRSDSLSNYQIWYSSSNFGSWSFPERISTDAGMESNIQDKPSLINIPEDFDTSVLVAWEGKTTAGGSQIFVTYKEEGFLNWEPIVHISNASGMDTRVQNNVSFSMNEGLAVFAWEGSTDTNRGIWVVYTADGEKWSAPECVTGGMGNYNQLQPSVTNDANGDIHVFWHGTSASYGTNQIWYSSHTFKDWNWHGPERISAGGSNFNASAALYSGNEVRVVWATNSALFTDARNFEDNIWYTTVQSSETLWWSEWDGWMWMRNQPPQEGAKVYILNGSSVVLNFWNMPNLQSFTVQEGATFYSNNFYNLNIGSGNAVGIFDVKGLFDGSMIDVNITSGTVNIYCSPPSFINSVYLQNGATAYIHTDIECNDLYINGYLYDLENTTIYINRNFNLDSNGRYFNSDGSTVKFTGSLGGSFNSMGPLFSFRNLSVDKSDGMGWINFGSSFRVRENFTIDGGNFWFMDDRVYIFEGNVVNNSTGSFTVNNSTVTFQGGNDQYVKLSTGTSVHNLRIAKPAGTVFMESGLAVGERFELINGTFDAGENMANEFYIRARDFNMSAGSTFIARDSKFIFNRQSGGMQRISTNGKIFHDILINRDVYWEQVEAVTDMAVAGSFELQRGRFEILASTVTAGTVILPPSCESTLYLAGGGILEAFQVQASSGSVFLDGGGTIRVEDNIWIGNYGELMSNDGFSFGKENTIEGKNGYFNFSVAGKVNVHTLLDILWSNGIIFQPTAQIFHFNNAAFDNVKEGNAAIRIDRSSGDLWLNNIDFGINVSTNVYAPNMTVSSITMQNCYGKKAGHLYENDPNNVIEWKDSIWPAQVSELSAVPGSANGEIDLSWIEPGDDGWVGVLAGYEIKYSTYSVSDASSSWPNLYTAYPPPPETEAPYKNVNHTITGLTTFPSYYIYIKAYDEVYNASFSSTTSMTGDYTKPVSTVTFPVHNQWIAGLNTISGTASDNIDHNIENLYLAIRRVEDSYYFNGMASFENMYSTFPATGGANISDNAVSWWYQNPSLDIALENGKTYEIYTYALDKRGNYETQNSTAIFRVDRSSPLAPSIIAPSQLYLSSLLTITGSAEDNKSLGGNTYSGMSKVEVAIQERPSLVGNYWNGVDSFDQPSATWNPAEISGDSILMNYQYTNLPSWIDGSEYSVYVRSFDIVNWTSPVSTFTFIFDISTPTISIVEPAVSKRVKRNSILIISGTANDNTSLEKVQYRIFKSASPNYWDGAGWTTSLTWLDAVSSDNWVTWNSTVSLSAANFADNGLYYLYARSIDKSLNYSSIYSSSSFIVDGSSPTSVISLPSKNFINTLSQISGTSTDPFGGVVAEMKIAVQDRFSGFYWNEDLHMFSYADIDDAYVTASGTNPWVYSELNSSHLVNGSSYTVTAYAFDTAGNRQDTASILTFTYELNPPTSTVTYPVHGSTINSLAEISGTGLDDFELNRVDIRIRRDSDNYYWNGSMWVADEAYVTASGTNSWTYDSSGVIWENNNHYSINSRALDVAGNYQVSFGTVTFFFDNSAPESVIVAPVDGIAYSLNNPISAVSGTAADNENLVAEVMVALRDNSLGYWWKDGSFQAEAPQWFLADGTDNWSWNLPELTDGASYYIKKYSVDEAGNAENESGINIYYDTTEPCSIVNNIEDEEVFYLSTLPNISGICADSFSGIESMGYALRLDMSPFSATPGVEDLYWDGSSWQSGEVFISSGMVVDGSNWTIDKGSIDFLAGFKYWISPRALDKAQNYQTLITTSSFYIAAQAAKLEVSGLSSPGVAGAAQSVTVRALDADDKVDFNYTNTVRFGVSEGPEAAGDELPEDYTFTASDMGEKSFVSAVTFKKAGSLRVLTASDTVSGISGYQEVEIIPAELSKIQVLVPGETAVPGTSTGKSGSSLSQTAGEPFTVTVNAVDGYFNVVSVSSEVVVVTDDPYDTHPGTQNLVNGTTNFTIDLRSRNVDPGWVVSAQISGLEDAYSSNIITGANDPKQLLIVLPGETMDEGSATGRSGAVTDIYEGTPFNIEVYACDDYFNINESYNQLVTFNATGGSGYILPESEELENGRKTFQVTLNESTTHQIKVSDADGTEPNLLSFNTDEIEVIAVHPSAVSDLTALTGSAEGEIRLQWTAPGDDGMDGQAVSYILKWDTAQIDSLNFDSATDYAQLWTPVIGGSAEEYTVSGFTGGTTYYFALKAIDESGNIGSWSVEGVNTANFAPAEIDRIPPDPISIFNAYTGSTEGKIDLSWVSTGDDGNTGELNGEFRIQYSQSSSGPWEHASAQVVLSTSSLPPGSPNSYTVDSLDAGVTYYFRIWSVDDLLNVSAESVSADNWAQVDVTPPSAISDLTALPGSDDGYITLSWTAPGDDEDTGTAAGYLVKYSLTQITSDSEFNSASEFVQSWPPEPAGSPEGPKVLAGFIPGTTYYFAIKAYDELGNYASWSADGVNTENFAPAQDLVPEPPVSPSITSYDSTSITIAWTAPDEPDISHYVVHYDSDTSGAPYAGFETVYSTTYTITGLTERVTYYIAVTVFDNTSNESAYSDELSVYTPATPPPLPGNFHGTCESTVSIKWAWTDEASNEAGYRIVDAGDNPVSPDLPPDTTYYIESDISGAAANDPITRKVQIFNETGSYGTSAVTVYTAPLTPDDLSVVSITSTTAVLSWTGDIPGSSAYYRIVYSTYSACPEANYTLYSSTISEAPYMFTADGLEQQKEYFFRIMAYNNSGVHDGYSAYVSTVTLDGIAPGLINDLSALTATDDIGRIVLSWTAPGDDGYTNGDAVGYIIRYSTISFTEADFSLQPYVIYHPAGTQGSTEILTVSALEWGEHYYFGIKTYDEIPNTSGMSNLAGAEASIKRWAGGIDNWSNPSAWTPAGVPVSTHVVVVDGGGVITMDSNFSVYQLKLTSGTINAGSNTLDIAGTMDNYSLIVNSSGMLNMGSGVLNLNGGASLLGGYEMSSATVSFSGAGTMNFEALPGSFGTIAVNGGSVVIKSGLTLNDKFILNNGAGISIDGTNIIYVQGDWYANGGALSASGSGSIIFNGNTDQYIYGSASQAGFGNVPLVVDKTAGSTLYFNKQIVCSGLFAINSGNVASQPGLIHTFSSNLIIDSSDSASFTLSASSASIYGSLTVQGTGSGSLIYLENGAKLALGSSSSININSGGEFRSDSPNSIISCINPGEYYAFNANSGSIINITGLTAEYLNSSGLNIVHGAVIYNNFMSSVTIRNMQSGGTAVNIGAIGSAHNYTFDSFNFADTSIAVNVSAPNLVYPGVITVTNYKGVRGGDSYDNDPGEPANDCIVWILETNPPNKITDLSAVSHTSLNGAVTLQFTAPWDDTGVTGYYVRYSTYAVNGNTTTWWNGAAVSSTTSPTADTGFVETINIPGLTSWTTYYFAVRARDSSNNIAPFPADSGLPYTPAVRASDIIQPECALFISSSAYNSLSAISGTAADTLPGSGLASIELQIINGSNYWNGSGWVGSLFTIELSPAGEWSYTSLPEWQHGQTYIVRAMSKDNAGHYSSYQQASFVFDNVAPGSVGDVTAEPTGFPGRINLSFTVPNDDDGYPASLYPVYYDIRYSVNDFLDTNFNDMDSIIAYNGTLLPGNIFTASVDGLAVGVTYYFHVKAVDKAGNVSDIDTTVPTASAVSGDNTPPEPISTLMAVSNQITGGIDLSWIVPHEDGPAGGPPEYYEIGYATYSLGVTNFGTASKMFVDNGLRIPGDLYELALTSLVLGYQYYFRIRSIDDSGNISDLDIGPQASAFAGDLIPPGRITDLTAQTASSGSGGLELSWTVPYEDGSFGGPPDYYRIAYATVSFAGEYFDLQNIITVNHTAKYPGEQYTYSIGGLEPQVMYFVRVISYDDAENESLPSNESSARASYTTETDITGSVKQSDGSVITGVIVEAIRDGRLSAMDATVDGIFRLKDLSEGGLYTVQATWTVNGEISSIYVENVPAGTAGVDFTLEINVMLANLEGEISGLSAGKAGAKGVYGAAQAGGSSGAFIELLQNGRVVAKRYTDSSGKYSVSNLLPGKYVIRAYNGVGYSAPQEITIREGQNLNLSFKFTLLSEKSVYNYPNPCSSKTTIRFTTDCLDIEAQIFIYTISGELVREIKGSELTVSGNEYSYEWDLKNSVNQDVASGVYLCQVKARDKQTKEKAVVIKKIAVIR